MEASYHNHRVIGELIKLCKIVPLYVLKLNWERNSKNGNAIERICKLQNNYANYVIYANYLTGKKGS